MQVYRGMDIGTAKPAIKIRTRIRHHMIDIVEPSDDFTVTEYQTQARRVIETGAGTRFLVTGGSGLHFRSIVDPLTFAPTDPETRSTLETMDPDALASELLRVDEQAADLVDMGNPRRVIRALEVAKITGQTPSERAASPEAVAVANYEPIVPHVSIGIDARDAANDRADLRFEAMMDAGLLREVERVADELGRTARQAVGYRELLGVIRGDTDLESAVEKAKASTRQLIKRQRTFFQRDPRIAWMPWQDGTADRIDAVARHIEKETSWTS
jgi:tRNA dimethylallyltransferase